MNITNKGKKIVNIGELALLPGMTAPLPESYEGNPVVGFLIERGTLSCDQPFCSSKMNRGELDTACAEHGIEVEDSDTIPTLQKKLIAKIQEG